MSETYIVTAKTIDEAIAIANKQYADAEHEISYDIIEMPKKGFLGFGSKEAKIKVTVNEIRDVDLESIVSDLRSMKMHTDREGRQNESKKRPAEQRSADNKPEAKQNQQRQPKAERSGENKSADNKPEAKQNQQRQPKAERPAENKSADSKPEAKQNQQRQPKAERPAENKSADNKPEAKQNQQRQQKAERPAENKPADNKPAEAKQNQQRQQKPERPAEQRSADSKPEAKQNQQRQPKAERPADNKPAETAEKAKQNAYAADAMPREHTEVIVSAPVGLFDLPAKEPSKSPFAAVSAAVSAEAETAATAETAAETAAVKAEPAVREPAETAEYTEPEESFADEAAAEEEVRETSVKVAVSEEEMTYALEFANTLLRNMQIDARAERGVCPEGETFETTEDADVYPRIEIVGSGTGILIGHHGETLDAIQYLVNLSAIRKARKANGHGDYVKIVVDVENYRTKREETLRTLARRMAARAVKTKKNVFLEPMNAYERRIIHSELQTYENVSTHSVGADKNRKIIITYEGPDKQPSGSRRKSGKDRPEGARTENGAAQKQERGERQHPGKSGGGERSERPRPRKPQKMPIEKLPDFLAASSTEPDEVLGIED